MLRITSADAAGHRFVFCCLSLKIMSQINFFSLLRQHMLIPKGLPEGLGCELFVMVSNYESDRVDQDLAGTCNDSASYCGVRDRLYPDRKPMGYPFDRLSRTGADRLATFLTPNMRSTDITIMHRDMTVMRQT